MIDDREFEADCVRRTLSGDVDAFRHLADRYEDRAFWVARGLLGNEEDARDATQDAFLRAFRCLSSFDTSRRFYTWLYRVVVNAAIDALRKRGRRAMSGLEDGEAVYDRWRDGSGAVERRELEDQVHAALRSLPEDYRVIMVLRDLQGLEAKEVGKILQVAPGTVRWRHHRARQLFRAEWRKQSLPTLAIGGGLEGGLQVEDRAACCAS